MTVTEAYDVIENMEVYACTEWTCEALKVAMQLMKNYTALEKEFGHYNRWGCAISERYIYDRMFEIMREGMSNE